MVKELTKKEEAFCGFFVRTRDSRLSAALAGFRLPQRSASKLISRSDIMCRIGQLEGMARISPGEVREGYRRLGFGSVADAVKLIKNFETLEDEDIERLDLFNVSEIKIPKNGGVEVKFFDRFKALAQLENSCETSADSINPLVAAIREGAEGLNAQAGDLYGDRYE